MENIRIKRELGSRNAQIKSEQQENFLKRLGMNTVLDDEVVEVGQCSLISEVYACPFKRESDGKRCLHKSRDLLEILNHFYHFHMDRVDLEKPRFPLCCLLACCVDQFILHSDLVTHMAKHGKHIDFVQMLVNKGRELKIKYEMTKDERKHDPVYECQEKQEGTNIGCVPANITTTNQIGSNQETAQNSPDPVNATAIPSSPTVSKSSEVEAALSTNLNSSVIENTQKKTDLLKVSNKSNNSPQNVKLSTTKRKRLNKPNRSKPNRHVSDRKSPTTTKNIRVMEKWSNNENNTGDLKPNQKNARFFVIKSHGEDNIHQSIDNNIWCSTQQGNKTLDNAFRERKGKGSVFLFFSVNGSKHFCGMAEMISSVNYNVSPIVLAQTKWTGYFDVKWIYVKDVPNSVLRHIRLVNNDNKPVTFSRDTQEVPAEPGYEILKIIYNHKHQTNMCQYKNSLEKAYSREIPLINENAKDIMGYGGQKHKRRSEEVRREDLKNYNHQDNRNNGHWKNDDMRKVHHEWPERGEIGSKRMKWRK